MAEPEITEPSEPTTADLLAFYAEKHAEKKRLDAELTALSAILDGIEEIVMDRMPVEIDSMNHTTESGVRLKISRKTTNRFQPAAGKSDDFWNWVRTNQVWTMTSRTVLQTGIEAWRMANDNQLPPFIEVATTSKLSVSVTTPAPRA